MSEKFNPAPTDRHAADPKQAVKSDKKLQSELDKGLEGTFAASDPASSTEPAKSKRCELGLLRSVFIVVGARRRPLRVRDHLPAFDLEAFAQLHRRYRGYALTS
jgi:hypothetical protein